MSTEAEKESECIHHVLYAIYYSDLFLDDDDDDDVRLYIQALRKDGIPSFSCVVLISDELVWEFNYCIVPRL